jgi:hypothetical protein
MVAAGNAGATAASVHPLELVINPNDVSDRPLVALAVTVLTNTDIDLHLTSDHRVRHPLLGAEDGTAIVGDLAMARYLLHRAGTTSLSADSLAVQAQVNAWMDYSSRMERLGPDVRLGSPPTPARRRRSSSSRFWRTWHCWGSGQTSSRTRPITSGPSRATP